MLGFTFTEEQTVMRGVVRDLMEDRVAPLVREIEDKGEYPVWVAELFREQGLFAVSVPEEYGGLDGRLLTQCVVSEEVARVSASCSMILGIQSLGAAPIALFGTMDQKARWLPPMATGEKVGAFGLTEPGAGSDIRALGSRAEKVEGGWRLNGRKAFITHANVADVVTVFAKADGEGGEGITAFLLETDREGFVIERVEEKMGLRASPTCSVALSDVFLPEENVLGRVGEGLDVIKGTLQKGRIGTAAQALGIAQGAFDAAATYVTQRTQFGRQLSRLQAVQQILGGVATEIEAARCLTYAAAGTYDAAGRGLDHLSAMCKLFATDTAMKATTEAVQVMGANGYMVEYGVERRMRDAKIFQIFEGANEVQRGIVAREMFRRTG